MSEETGVVLVDNVFIHFRLLKYNKEMNKAQLLSRELWRYLKPGYYRLTTEGQLVAGKALDLTIHNFVIDASVCYKEIADYIECPDKEDNINNRTVCMLKIIPVVFYHDHYHRGGEFGLVCCKGVPVYLVRTDNSRFATVQDAARAAMDLLYS